MMKSNILSTIPTIYDPVGYLEPITIQLKILFQEICNLDVDWDDVVKEILPKWKSICEFLNSLQELPLIDVIFMDDPIESYF